MEHRLKNKVIWLTGASSGIGEALALELARCGSVLALTSRSEDRLKSVVDNIRSIGGKAFAFPADVTKQEELTAAVKNINENIGDIDILVANAGTHIFTVPEAFDSKEYLGLLDINFGGMLRSIEAVLGKMYAKQNGHIVVVASMAGFRGVPRAGAYGASKAAMIHFMESIRFHLVRKGIKVTIVNPGFVKTPLTDKNDFYMPFLVSAEYSARIIVKGIEKNKKQIDFPWPFNWMLHFMRVCPYFLYEFIIDKLWKLTEKTEKK